MGILLVLDVGIFIVPAPALLELLASPRGDGSLEGSTAIGGDRCPGGDGLLEGVDVPLDGVELRGQLLHLDQTSEIATIEDDALGGKVEGLVTYLKLQRLEGIGE